jgi:6-phospho-beta-glucosidase
MVAGEVYHIPEGTGFRSMVVNSVYYDKNGESMMEHLKITIIGAGSSYTPELVERLAGLKDRLPVGELAFMDINPQRMETVAGFCRRFMKNLGHEIPIHTTTDRKEAVSGAQFIVTQVRVGGNAQRVLDEKIPLKFGIIGQETTGPGGMFKALRTIPVMLDIARDVEALSPEAWIINYANPTGLNAEAVLKHSQAKFVGLCSGVFFPRQVVARALGATPESISYDYFGLNHLNFAYNLSVNGRKLSDAEFDRVADEAGGDTDRDLIKILGLIPSGYLRYYFHRSKCVEEAQKKPLTRGETVQMLEEEVFRAYADPQQATKPEALSKRGGGGYSEIALGVIEAIYDNLGKVEIVNTTNRGAAPFLPEDAVLELPCTINAAGIIPLIQPEIPRAVWGLVAAVKNYEQLTVEAAIRGDRRLALEALLAHPLVGDWEMAVKLLDEMLEANRAYLPQFYG